MAKEPVTNGPPKAPRPPALTSSSTSRKPRRRSVSSLAAPIATSESSESKRSIREPAFDLPLPSSSGTQQEPATEDDDDDGSRSARLSSPSELDQAADAVLQVLSNVTKAHQRNHKRYTHMRETMTGKDTQIENLSTRYDPIHALA